MKNKTSTSEDANGISNKMMNMVMQNPIMKKAIIQLFNLTISTNYVPAQLKSAKIIPTPKTTKIQSLNDLRPISILPVLAKLLEKCVYLQLIEFILKYNILCENQFGFRPFHSTHHAELKIYNLVKSALSKNNMCAIVTLDIRKAFDTICRYLLCDKLESYNIDSKWFNAYLTPRSQTVSIDKHTSSTANTINGIVQGGCLSGILFAIYINDLAEIIKNSNLTLYADDQQTFKELRRDHLETDLDQLQEDCNEVTKWMANNGLSLNTSKTELIVHCRKKDQLTASNIQIKIGESIIRNSTTIKTLGLTKDSLLTWGPHIKNVTNSCYRSLHKIRSLRNQLNQKTH
ncbi:RNA-directed DNA polymerase from mobile element jockey [Orchesella cincta]|uniref:RNA-directed DNA polymerase from mobile element jockey n=1 Tax=Orchesella cincta TaxID=48709 RepID=A0A1D2M5K7_ORCCI|nr:RNA-directed DNA polymerase from mobile element jockey [Orchesella cincta]